MLSMTGYGIGEAPHRNGRVIVEVRAVNHRYLDVRVRLPAACGDSSPLLESYARKKLERGRIEVLVRLEGDAVPALKLDSKRAREAYEQLSALRDEISPGEPVPMSLLASVPDLFTATVTLPYSDEAIKAINDAMNIACDQVLEMRSREGAALASDLHARLVSLRQAAAAVRKRSPEILQNFQARLHERVASLTNSLSPTVDKGRLEQEVALLAERSDIEEELTRFASHCDQFRDLLGDTQNGPVGRKLDFLLQEMSREVNTLGAKSADVEISRAVVGLKAELERMREQVQNVV